MVAMATTLFTVYCKLFHMMPYIIILKVIKFYQPTASRFRTARKKPVGGTLCPPSLNWVNLIRTVGKVELISTFTTAVCKSWYVGDKYTWDNAEDLKQLSMDQTLSEDNRSD